jgi:HPt (histidine-containing phosphotransfer) domain-containing protein
VAIRDISIRKAAETHLAQMEGRYRGLAPGVSPSAEETLDKLVGPASSPAIEPAIPDSGSELPILDLGAFERTAGYLAPEVLARHLQTIAERGKALQRGLGALGAATRAGSELSDAAHVLAGIVSMFGFERLAAAARGFERAVQTGAEDVPILAHNLNTALAAALQQIPGHPLVSADT